MDRSLLKGADFSGAKAATGKPDRRDTRGGDADLSGARLSGANLVGLRSGRHQARFTYQGGG